MNGRFENTERDEERRGEGIAQIGTSLWTSTGNSGVISRLPDLGVVQHETQIGRTLPIRNYMLCRRG